MMIHYHFNTSTMATSSVTLFTVNYLYDLPDELQAIIYRKLFNGALKSISDKRDALDSYDKLVAYIKNTHYSDYSANNKRAIWSIFLCNRQDVGDSYGDSYYKYFLYYADNETDFLRLTKTKMTRYNEAYSAIRYIEFSIYPLEDNVSPTSYRSFKKILEEYAVIFLCNYSGDDNEYGNIKGIEVRNNKLRIEYVESRAFRCHIDIYNNILVAYNFVTRILNILNVYNQYYPLYNLEYMNDINDLRKWFEYNSFFSGFKLNECGDTIHPSFYS